MTDEIVNKPRRNFLIAATSAVGSVGLLGAAVPFVQSWTPSAKARALGGPLRLDLNRLQPGELLGPIRTWRGNPIFVFRRTEVAVTRLAEISDLLQDPDSELTDQQPEYARNVHRSRNPEIAVLVGLCTHLGCSPKFYGESRPESFDADWQGGFFCPCHGSKFDLAGRVYKGVPAPSNMVVPPHFFEADDMLVIGIEEESA